LRIAVVKPGIARNQTAFEAMAELYHYVSRKHDAEVTIFSDASDHYEDEQLDVIELRPLQLPKILGLLGLPHFKFYPSLIGKLKNYDVIIASDPTLYFNHCYFAYLAAKRRKARLLVDLSLTLPVPKFSHGLKSMLKRCISKQVAQYTYRFLVTTPLAAERYRKLDLCSNLDKFLVLGHPVDTNKFKPRPEKNFRSLDRLTILSVGRLVPEKGFQFILKALLPILRRYVHVKWLIVGEGPYESKLRKLIRDNWLEQQVKISDPVPHSKLPNIYQQADIFVGHPISTPYWEEFFGVVYVEAMACGLPVISSYCGGVPYVIPDGQVGYLVPQKDVAQLTEKLELLINNETLRRRLGQQARDYVLEHYSVEKLGERFYCACSGAL